MADLQQLNLTGTPISDAGLNYLATLKSLRHLDLSGTRIADPRLEAVRMLPRLMSIDVRGTQVTALDVFRAVAQTRTWERNILAALDEKTEADFFQQPLVDVLDYFQERHDIPIKIDHRSLIDAGVDCFKQQITIKEKGATFRETLQAILGPLGLAMAVRHEVLFIAAKPMPDEIADFPVVPAGQRLSPKIANALMTRCNANFIERPFQGAISDLAQQGGVEIELDAASLAKAGLPLDCPITKQFKGLTLKSCLELVLQDLDLTCVAEGEKLIIRNKADR